MLKLLSQAVAVVCLVFSVNVACAGGRPLVNPPAVVVSQGITKAQVKQAIEKAIPTRGWLIKTAGDDAYEVFYLKETAKDSFALFATVTYSDSSVQVKYKDSQNLQYEKAADGTETAHRVVSSWLLNLSTDIKAQLMALSVMSVPVTTPEVVPTVDSAAANK